MLDRLLVELESEVQEGMVVHKRQAVWVLTLFMSKATPGVSYQ
jgi:hypothetical protein